MINQSVILAAVEAALARKAEAGLNWLVNDALSRPGSGILHAGSPNRSSAADEYPAEQLSLLKASMDERPAGHLARAMGSFQDKDAQGFEEARQLEERPVSEGGRHWLEMAFHDPELHRVLRETL